MITGILERLSKDGWLTWLAKDGMKTVMADLRQCHRSKQVEGVQKAPASRCLEGQRLVVARRKYTTSGSGLSMNFRAPVRTKDQVAGTATQDHDDWVYGSLTTWLLSARLNLAVIVRYRMAIGKNRHSW